MQHDNDCTQYCKENPSQCASDGVTVMPSNQPSDSGRYIMWPYSVDGTQPNNNMFSPCSLEFGGNVRYTRIDRVILR